MFNYRIIFTISEKVVANKRTIDSKIICVISINKPPNGRIVISALEVVEPGFVVVVLAAGEK